MKLANLLAFMLLGLSAQAFAGGHISPVTAPEVAATDEMVTRISDDGTVMQVQQADGTFQDIDQSQIHILPAMDTATDGTDSAKLELAHWGGGWHHHGGWGGGGWHHRWGHMHWHRHWWHPHWHRHFGGWHYHHWHRGWHHRW